MGRRRKHDTHLPKRVYLDHGTHWFRPKGAKPVNLGQDFAAAMVMYGQLVGPAIPVRTVAEAIDRYKTEVLPKKRSEATRENQAEQLDRLKRVFGAMLPDSITAQHCYRYMDARRKKVGKAQVEMPAPIAARHEISLLGHVIQKAIRWGAATVNAVRAVDFGPRAPKRPQVPMDQVRLVMALAKPRIALAIELAVEVGPRRGDLLKFTRANETDEGLLFINGKTGARQLIEWTPNLRALVARCHAQSPQVPGEYLIRKANGHPYTADGFSAIWQRLMRKHVAAGGQRFSFHDLRSVSADGAATPEEARDRLGHASVETTKRHYLRGVTKGRPRS
jgi:integrase